MRLIDADALRDKIAVLFERNPKLIDGWLAYAVEDTIDDAPTIDPVKWIPVSEAMPEESDGTVLVCMPNKSPYDQKEPFVNAKHNRQVETAAYSQYSDTWHFKNGGVTSVRPIAWMPLPEPWRGEKEWRET